MVPKARFGILKKHIAKEFLLSFLVSFVFFFFIFFINQILLLVQKILLKNVSILSMLKVVSLAIPQFLIYTIPFASLSASCMTLGDLSSYNELLAIQSVGIPIKKVYSVLMVASLVLTLSCYAVADFLQPWSAVKYQSLLSTLMQDIPTFELRSNSVNRVGDIVLSVGKVDEEALNDVIILDNSASSRYGKTVMAEKAVVRLIDPVNFIYELKLINPEILLTENNNNYSHIKSESAIYYLNFSSQVPQITNITPNNLSSKDLYSLILSSKEDMLKDREIYLGQKNRAAIDLIDSINEYNLTGNEGCIKDIDGETDAFKINYDKAPIAFFYQYYLAELSKKFALSFSCIALIYATLSLATFKIKYGRLFGFGFALILAVAYWYMLFASQLFVFKVHFNAGLLLWIPNAIMLLFGATLLFATRKRR